MPQAHPYQVYETTNVQTADQAHLIIMLYDGAIRFLKKGRGKIYTGDVEGAHNYLVRSREIVSELLSTLRPEKAGEIGANLKQIYVYVYKRIVEANLMKDAAAVDEVIEIMSVLREGWVAIKSKGKAATREDRATRHVDLQM
ncbi:MAG: flagellar export chaperone FliS [SAR324 cluster bacterium]|nr:flagellar export chaperone FliS [SAR324 cluster bacterium]MCZ6557704.1 flagellar export chaperone FliS [SAR324 cluster bacterium]MCZ6645005.1 flagellar export chaperone FliS [SAR324 cluster bacterium]